LASELPNEWKEIEEEDNDVASRFIMQGLMSVIVEINNQLGPLAVLLYKRLTKLKILSGLDA
jgi:hypothetical protein